MLAVIAMAANVILDEIVTLFIGFLQFVLVMAGLDPAIHVFKRHN
jgi:hypothetical protein